jgi:hypothetical protein
LRISRFAEKAVEAAASLLLSASAAAMPTSAATRSLLAAAAATAAPSGVLVRFYLNLFSSIYLLGIFLFVHLI